MGLRRATIAKIVTTAFNVLGDIPETVTYRRSTSTYVPSTGTNTVVNTDTSVSMVFTSYNAYEIDRVNITALDIKGLMESRLISVTPNVTTDKIVRSSKVYNILSVKLDPSNSLYTFQLRAV